MALALKHIPDAIQDPPLAKAIFASPKAALFWLPLRLYLGYQWITASEHKITDPGWMVTGEALKKSWLSSAALPAAPAKAPITFDWYRSFLQFMLDHQAYTWFAKLIACGELLVGIALILGLFTGIAAFFGGFMNWNFMMAGSASTNPFLFTIAVGLVLAWKVAGYYGLDYFVLPALGTPWQPGSVVGGERTRVTPVPATA
jgi:thiosulfate dehydrogenase (quinone) large subunit